MDTHTHTSKIWTREHSLRHDLLIEHWFPSIPLKILKPELLAYISCMNQGINYFPVLFSSSAEQTQLRRWALPGFNDGDSDGQ